MLCHRMMLFGSRWDFESVFAQAPYSIKILRKTCQVIEVKEDEGKFSRSLGSNGALSYSILWHLYNLHWHSILEPQDFLRSWHEIRGSERWWRSWSRECPGRLFPSARQKNFHNFSETWPTVAKADTGRGKGSGKSAPDPIRIGAIQAGFSLDL